MNLNTKEKLRRIIQIAELLGELKSVGIFLDSCEQFGDEDYDEHWYNLAIKWYEKNKDSEVFNEH